MNNQPTHIKKYVGLGLVLVVVLIAGIVVRSSVIGNKYVQLNKAQPLYGQISQVLLTGTGGNKVLSANDYKLSGVKYLDNQAWVVAHFTQPGSQGGYVLLNKVGQFYQVVLGPGTLFPANLTGIPSDVTQYLSNNGLLEVNGT
ncbi:MAG: hypothetical protein WDN66_00540 [Candidatus Saccharibacteria bacterium]